MEPALAAPAAERTREPARARPNHEPVRNRELGTSLGGTSERVARPTSRRSGTPHTGTSRCSLENEPRAPSRSRNSSGRSRCKSPRAQSPGVVERPLRVVPPGGGRAVARRRPQRTRRSNRRRYCTRDSAIRPWRPRPPRSRRISRKGSRRSKAHQSHRRRTVYRRPAPGSTRLFRRASSWGLRMREPGRNPCADVDRGEQAFYWSNFVICYT